MVNEGYYDENGHIVHLEVGDGPGNGAAEEADLYLLVDLLAADGDLEKHLIGHLQIDMWFSARWWSDRT